VSRRLLIVEDDPNVREAFAARLSAEGYQIVTADDGRDALARLETGPLPDAILLDYAMPVMDGRAFREAQLADPRWARIPVILITGYLQRSFAARSLDVAAILEKPVRWEELEALLRRLCASPPAADGDT
jgi:two-component system chemotaxis sensor kinase CheA